MPVRRPLTIEPGVSAAAPNVMAASTAGATVDPNKARPAIPARAKKDPIFLEGPLLEEEVEDMVDIKLKCTTIYEGWEGG